MLDPRGECGACPVGIASDTCGSQRCPFVLQRFAAGTSIYAQGAPADTVFFVKSGALALFYEPSDGQERMHALRLSRDFIGLECIVSATYYHSARAVSELETCAMSRSDMAVWLGPGATAARTALEGMLRMAAHDVAFRSLDAGAVQRIATWLGGDDLDTGLSSEVASKLLTARSQLLPSVLDTLSDSRSPHGTS